MALRDPEQMIEFFVEGTPVPKGSAKALMLKGMKFPVVFQDNAGKQKPWAKTIALICKSYIRTPFAREVPIRLSLAFYFDRPLNHSGKHGVKDSAPRKHVKKPDLDKLIRCVKDALTKVAYEDDSQVCQLGECSKNYVGMGKAGVIVKIEPLV